MRGEEGWEGRGRRRTRTKAENLPLFPVYLVALRKRKERDLTKATQ